MAYARKLIADSFLILNCQQNTTKYNKTLEMDEIMLESEEVQVNSIDIMPSHSTQIE